MNTEFKGKRALVTGAGKGIGRACAVALYEAGADVFALSRTQVDLDSLKEELPDIHILCVDLRDWKATHDLVKSALPIELLVNNAGVSQPESFLDVKEESFDYTFDINMKAPLFLAQLVARDMVARKQAGVIVNVSSISSCARLYDHTTYCMSKSALDTMTKMMAVELGPYKIRTNSVNPVVTLTQMGIEVWSDPVKQKPMIDKIPLGRFAEVKDVTTQILHLLSEKSAMLNGVILPIDGGFLAH